jgi:hypothetical protein
MPSARSSTSSWPPKASNWCGKQRCPVIVVRLEIRRLQAQAMTMAQIGDELNRRGVKTALGWTWRQSTVSRLIKAAG